MTNAETAAPALLVEGCVAAHATLLADIADLRDDVVRRPSRLPGWTVGHVLTHIARNADSVVWRLDGAARSELRDQYPGGLEQRTGDIDAGAGRPAAELIDDVRQSAHAVEQAMADLSPAAWDAPSRTSRGVVESSREAALSRSARGRRASRRSRTGAGTPPAGAGRRVAATGAAAVGRAE